MPKKDLVGERFGMLAVIAVAESTVGSNGKTHRKWLCKCDCGRTKAILQTNLVEGRSSSCGCMKGKAQRLHEPFGWQRPTQAEVEEMKRHHEARTRRENGL